jgi:hypothetical protein
MDIRKLSLHLAEAVDAWRVVPRMILVCYAWLVNQLYLWYTKIPTYVQEKCDAAVLQIFLESGMELEKAQKLACTVIDVVGGPTPAQSAFVTTIIGLSTGIFGLYASTGRKWDKSESQINIVPYTPNMPSDIPSEQPISKHKKYYNQREDTGPKP